MMTTPWRFFSVCCAVVLLAGSYPLSVDAVPRSEAADTNKDGKPDEWKIYDEKDHLIRMEKDRDGDGRAEVAIFFDDTQPKPKPVRSEVDRNGDGKPDLVRWLKAGQPEREQADLNFDGKADGWTFYKNGQKDLMILDKNYDGKPDAWFYYGMGGMNLIGGKVDENYDGTFDRTWGLLPTEETRQPW